MASKYLSGGASLVYLDQCAVSRFHPERPDPEWREVHDALREGTARSRFVIPHSLEHAVETAGMPADDAALLDGELRDLSCGWALRTEPELVAAEISAGVRSSTLRSEDFLIRGLLKPLSDPDVYAFLRTTKADLDRYNEQRVEFVNALNAAARVGRRQTRGLLIVMMDVVAEDYRNALGREVVQSLRTGGVTITGRPDRPDVPTWPSVIVGLLIRVQRFERSDFEALAERLAVDGIAFVPFFRVKAALEAYGCWRGERIEPGDQYDRTRIACALPFADVLVTDGGVATALRELGLDQAFGTEVFSTKLMERQALLRRLRALLQA